MAALEDKRKGQEERECHRRHHKLTWHLPQGVSSTYHMAANQNVLQADQAGGECIANEQRTNKKHHILMVKWPYKVLIRVPTRHVAFECRRI